MAPPLHTLVVPRQRSIVLGALIVVVFLGLGSRAFTHVLPTFLAVHSGDALWTVAVYLSVAFAFPRWSPVRLGLIAWCVSVGVELSQLLQFPWLVALREWSLGRLFLGSGFLWIDLARYAAGALLATMVDGLCQYGRGTPGTEAE